MITLITGGPGTGKTAWLLDQLIDLRKSEPNRELYIHGVRNLRGIAHEAIYCKSQLCDICRSKEIPSDAKYVETWPEWKQPGSLIVVDEVQRIWRPRTGGSQPHESVSGLETHRHYGIDFWLISQGPHLFDNFIRMLVGRHVHLVAKWNGRTQYEWPECKQDVQSRSDAVIRGYSLPTRVYSMYDSAEVHTKQEKRKPMSLYVAIVALILCVVMVVFVGYRLKTRIAPVDSVAAGTGGGAPAATPVPSSVQTTIEVQPKQSYPDYKPRINGLPDSAPAYAELIQVTAVPHLMGCVKTPEWCRCYTNQGTPYPSSNAFCGEYIAGHVYNPYRSPKPIQQNENQTSLVSNDLDKKLPGKTLANF